MKKNNNFSELMSYAGKHRYLTYSALVLSVISAVLMLLPFVFIFFIIKEVIEVAPNFAEAVNVARNGWLAVLFALISIVVYIGGLMCSYLSAFRIAGNMRKALMSHIEQLPLGFVGEMGSGKTTTAGLISRFWDVSGGEIKVGGVNVKNIEKSELMNTVSYVFQDSRLLKTSILENVRLANPNASREEVEIALHKAQCDDIIAKLPNRIDKMLDVIYEDTKAQE